MNTTPTGSPNATASTRGFWALIVTQFQGAFSDNIVKNLVVLCAVFGTTMTDPEKNHFGELAGALFAVPFILFSMAGGFLADRCSKRSVMIGVKLLEFAIIALAMFGLHDMDRNILLVCVFLMGTHSAFFGPSKYGSLPELLPAKKLSWGNGVLELGTFVAIILGTFAAALMAGVINGSRGVGQLWPGLLLLALTVIGLAFARHITKVPAANPAKKFNPNFPAEVWRELRAMRGDRPLWLAIIGNTYFSFFGALLLLNVVFYGANVLHVSEEHVGLLNVALALGIGLGSVAAGYLSGGKIEYGLVPLGAFGLTVFSVSLAWPGVGLHGAFALLAMLGFSGGFFIVPIMALLQHRPAAENKGQIQAVANLLSFVGVFLASGVHWLIVQQFQLSPRGVFLVGGLMTLVGAIYVLILLPDALLRFLLWCATNTIYKIRVVGRENFPARGGALLVCNHLSFADALLVIGAVDRPVRFMMFKGIYERRSIKPFAKILKVIPVSSDQRPRELIHSLQAATEAIKNGEIVCIFAEGQITRIGQLLPFQRGFERIMKDVDAPIIPIALDGVIGSPTSFEHGRMVRHFPDRLPHPVTVSFGKPMPAQSTAIEVREAVQELIADGWQYRRAKMEPMPRQFVRCARRHPERFAMTDVTNGSINFGTALVRTVFLARRLKKIWRGQNMVGLLLPPSVPGALVNYAAFLCGKVPVNLNYTLSESASASCMKQCHIKDVITSRKFLEKLKLNVPGNLLYLEDLAADPTTMEKVIAWLSARLLPINLLEKSVGDDSVSLAPLGGEGRGEGALDARGFTGSNRTPHPNPLPSEGRGDRKRQSRLDARLDSLATVIFSSGSTGEPKGVMLSHYNILSNMEQFGHILNFTHRDRFLGILPFFHSFGFTVTLCLPASIGGGVVYHANPLDSRAIGALVREHSITLLMATPTFLQLYMRGVSSADFGSLQLVITGAEKLSERLADAFQEQFGIRPLEGYGTTECAPAVAVNIIDFRAAGFHQIGGKRGKIGRALPGMMAKIADADHPWDGQSVPPGQPGMLLVRGPNIMQGYLGQPEKTAEVLRHGWYCTGDIATMDEDGFLQITGRLSRFSKIGGEMVPHIKIEEKLQEVAGKAEQTFVVTGVPDEKKGERLVVLHKLAETDLPAVLEQFSASDLPNLWKPKAGDFYRVENFPMLGTGKLDLRGVKETAAKLAGGV